MAWHEKISLLWRSADSSILISQVDRFGPHSYKNQKYHQLFMIWMPPRQLTYPTKREVRKIIDSKVRLKWDMWSFPGGYLWILSSTSLSPGTSLAAGFGRDSRGLGCCYQLHQLRRGYTTVWGGFFSWQPCGVMHGEDMSNDDRGVCVSPAEDMILQLYGNVIFRGVQRIYWKWMGWGWEGRFCSFGLVLIGACTS